MKIAFASFRHSHVFVLYEMAKQNALFEIVGACEENAEARKVAEQKGVVFTCETYDELLSNKDIEVIVIGSCYGDRGTMAIKALKAGKHVICDKPLCTDENELNEIERLAKEKGLIVSCMFTMRFEEKIVAVKKCIDEGKLGKVSSIYFGGQHPLQYGRRPSWYFEKDKHGGVINDIAIHGIDLLNYLFGFEIKKIHSARCWNSFATEEKNFLDSAQFMIEGKDGVGVIADVSYAIPDGVEFDLPYYWQFYIWGSNGTISFSMNKDPEFYQKGEKQVEILKANKAQDYLKDFLLLVNGKKDAVLSPEEVFNSTRCTLMIQAFANKNVE